MAIEVTSEALERLLAEARAAHPHEACGILLGQGERIDRIVPADNIHPDPEQYFEIDPQALVDAHRAERSGGPQVLGYYHSHPAGPAGPSATDRAQASGDGRIWAIVAGEEIGFWRDRLDGFAPLSYTLAGR